MGVCVGRLGCDGEVEWKEGRGKAKHTERDHHLEDGQVSSYLGVVVISL